VFTAVETNCMKHLCVGCAYSIPRYLGVLDSAVNGLCVTDDEKAEPTKYAINFGANKYVILKYGCVKR